MKNDCLSGCHHINEAESWRAPQVVPDASCSCLEWVGATLVLVSGMALGGGGALLQLPL